MALSLGCLPLLSYLRLFLSSLHCPFLKSCLLCANFCFGPLFFWAVSSIQPSSAVGRQLRLAKFKRFLFSAASAAGYSFSARMLLFLRRCLFLTRGCNCHFNHFFRDPAQRQMLAMFQGSFFTRAPVQNGRRTRKSWKPFSKSWTNLATAGAPKPIDKFDFRFATGKCLMQWAYSAVLPTTVLFFSLIKHSVICTQRCWWPSPLPRRANLEGVWRCPEQPQAAKLASDLGAGKQWLG